MMTNAPTAPRSDHDREAHHASLESSRRVILEAVRSRAPFVLVRSIGNLGDQLIAAGARRLFADIDYRETSIDEAVRSRGATAVLMGSGAWCAPFHEIMPAALTALAARYERLVVLPSSFDVSVSAVRRAVERSGAVIFARERESLRQIATLCDARLAHDTAFFFDFSPYARSGSGVLRAYRNDAEATGHSPIEASSRDISTELGSLDEWLWTIARHEEVHTDRAHVMIAAALLGKRVEIHPSTTHKVTAIAQYALADFPVRAAMNDRTPVAAPAQQPQPLGHIHELRRRLTERGDESLRRIPAEWLARGGDPRVSIVVLSRNRLEQTTACIASIVRHVRIPFRLRVVEDASEPRVRRELARVCVQHPFAELQQLETNRGCAAARQLAVENCDTEFVAFIDDDAEVFPGAIEHLVYALEEHPEACVAGARVVLPDASLQFCGGDFQVRDGVIRFEALERGRSLDDPAMASQACRWIPGTAFACRREIFADFPIDTGMSTYFEDNEWCYRIHQAQPRAFRTAAEAFILHHQESKERRGSTPAELLRASGFIAPIAHFYTRHGLVMEDLFGFIPELVLPDGTRDIGAARLLLELATAKGSEWLGLQWVTGGLATLFLRRNFAEVTSSRSFRLAQRYWSLRARAARAIGKAVR
jgi:GT2 family glycosyltransferase